jgi:hypothetical protein
MIVPYGIGDTVILCGLKEDIEKLYGGIVVPVINKSHEIIMEMYGIDTYEFNTFDDAELEIFANELDAPACGRYFVAHPAFGKNKCLNTVFLNHKVGFVEMFLKHFGIKDNILPKLPPYRPFEILNLQERLKILDYDKVVLLVPELKSAGIHERVQDRWFVNEANKWEEKGYRVIINNEAQKPIFKNYEEQLTLKELAYLASRVGRIIAQRSGFCDMVYGFVRYMDIIYPNYAFYDLFCMKKIFEKCNPNVTELVPRISVELINRNYRTVAIYGFGGVGQRILYSLQFEGMNVKYLIDKNPLISSPIQCYLPDDKLPKVDVVLICVEDTSKEIRKELLKQNIMSVYLNDIMNFPHFR